MAEGVRLNFERQQFYLVLVRVSDGTSSAALIQNISIGNLNDAPLCCRPKLQPFSPHNPIAMIVTMTVPENSPAGTIVGTEFVAYDEDLADSL